MLLCEYMCGTTHRQHLGWVEWLKRQWNKPDRQDYYLMQIAFRVLQSIVKDPKSVKLKDCVIEFGQSGTPTPKKPVHPQVAHLVMTPERMIEARKAMARAQSVLTAKNAASKQKKPGQI